MRRHPASQIAADPLAWISKRICPMDMLGRNELSLPREGRRAFFLAVRLNEGTGQSSCPSRRGIHQRALRERRTRGHSQRVPASCTESRSHPVWYNLGNAGAGGAPAPLAPRNSVENPRILCGGAQDAVQEYRGKPALWTPWQNHDFLKNSAAFLP